MFLTISCDLEKFTEKLFKLPKKVTLDEDVSLKKNAQNCWKWAVLSVLSTEKKGRIPEHVSRIYKRASLMEKGTLIIFFSLCVQFLLD